jgi:hypothetical protein
MGMAANLTQAIFGWTEHDPNQAWRSHDMFLLEHVDPKDLVCFFVNN